MDAAMAPAAPPSQNGCLAGFEDDMLVGDGLIWGLC